jgi:hypothetical protein
MTGDSIMRNPTDVLKPWLEDRAHVVDDVYVGSGITRPFVVDWATLPAKQVKAYQPDATVISIGMGDGRDLLTPAGPVSCCGADYVVAYARRVRAIMSTYLQDGDGAVVWLDDPYPRDVSRAAVVTAVNQAVGRAASGLDRVVVLDLAAVFTPKGTFQPTLVRKGRTVTVRRPDGVHLSRAGARIAGRLVTAELRRLGVLGSS